MDDQQKRLFLALALSAGVAVLWQVLFVPPVPRDGELGSGAGAGAEVDSSATGSAQAGAGGGTGAGAASGAPSAVPVVEALPPQRLLGEGFTSHVTNVGGRVSHVEIREPEQYIPRDDFGGIFPHGEEQHLPFGMEVEGLGALDERSMFRFVEEESTRSTTDPEAWARLVYRWSDGAVEVDKVFSVTEQRYVTHFDLVFRDVAGTGRAIGDIHLYSWADDSNAESTSATNPTANQQEAICFTDGEAEHETFGDLEDGPISYRGETLWAGVDDRYFLTAVVVPEGAPAAGGCDLMSRGTFLGARLTLDGFALGAGEARTVSLMTYTGPKEEAALTAAGSFLTRSVNYGFFAFVAYPMKWVLKASHGLVGNWGLAIIMLTILVKLLLFPVTQKTFRSMERMKKIQPLLTEVRDKYQNDRTKMTEETMRLYKEHNVNPFGCLPMFLQFPVYIALYRTIYSSVELYKAEFALWIHDLSQPDPYYILPVLMSVTMFGQQLLMPTTVDNPQMKWMMRIMPLIFGFFMLVLPSGLVLYIFVSSLLGILQQWYIRREQADPKDGGPTETPESKLTRQQRRHRERQQTAS